MKLVLPLITTLLLASWAKSATIVVTNTNDAGVGSLREAIGLALSGDIVDMTGISGAITLTSGELNITANTNITINGPGANNLTIDCNYNSRAFNIYNADVVINNLRIINGLTNDNNGGGGIRAVFGSDLTLSYCIIENCEASESLNTRGGGIDVVTYDPDTWTENGPVTAIIEYCQIENCRSYIGGGARLIGNSEPFTIEIRNSTFKNNSTGAYGAISSGNDGGGLEIVPHQNSVAQGTNVFIGNSTFSANSTGGPFNARSGGALSLGTGIYDINSCTFSTNNTPTDGGAIAFWGMDGTCTLTNTIAAQNTAGGSGNDLSGTFLSGGYNLIGDVNGATWTAGTGDITGTTGSPVNAQLFPLAANGGFGETHAMDCNSPAIDAGGNNPTLDQRDLGRVCDPDIGAFEYQVLCFCAATDTVYICLGDSLFTDGVYQANAGTYGDTTIAIISSAINPAGPICIHDPNFTLTADSTGGTWSGTGIVNVSTGEFSPSTAGVGFHTITYEINYTINGISYTCSSQITVEVTDVIVATITPAGPFCLNDDQVVLSASTIGGLWSGPGVDPTTGTFTPATAGIGTAQIIYTVPGACGDADTIDIIVNDVPTIDAGTDVTILSGESTILTGAGATTLVWEPPTGLSCTNCPSPNASPSITTTYTLTGMDANGCSSTDIVTINVIQLEQDLFIPNIFSPNGDNNNDVFKVEGTGLNEFQLKIFNRWGELVFSSDDQQFGWDGTQRGKALNTAVFTYLVTYVSNLGEEKIISGNVTLLRSE